MSDFQFECVEPDQDVYDDYSSRFASYNQEKSGWEIETFSVISRENDAIVAGGRGIIYLGALELRGLWVDETLRGKGLGSKLLTQIEDIAKERNAKKAMLYTYSWQAESFYKGHGYTEFGRFHFPDGYSRVDMQKSF